MEWEEHGAAVTCTISDSEGVEARIALSGSRAEPSGATICFPAESPDVVPLSNALDRLLPQDVMSILCRQEVAFGKPSNGVSS